MYKFTISLKGVSYNTSSHFNIEITDPVPLSMMELPLESQGNRGMFLLVWLFTRVSTEYFVYLVTVRWDTVL